MSCNHSNDNNVGSGTSPISNTNCRCTCNCNCGGAGVSPISEISPIFTCPPKKEVCCNGIHIPCFNRCTARTALNYVDSIFDIKKGEATAVTADFRVPLTGPGAQEANLISNFTSNNVWCNREFSPSPNAKFIVESAAARVISVAPCRPFDNDDIEINCKPLTSAQSVTAISPNLYQINLGEFASQIFFDDCRNGAKANIRIKPFKIGYTIQYTLCGTVIDGNCAYKFFIRFNDTNRCSLREEAGEMGEHYHQEPGLGAEAFLGARNVPDDFAMDLFNFDNNEVRDFVPPLPPKHHHDENCDKISSFVRGLCIPRRASIFPPYINLVYSYDVDFFNCVSIKYHRGMGPIAGAGLQDAQLDGLGCNPCPPCPTFGYFEIRGTSIITPSVLAESVRPIRALSLINPVEDPTFTED